MKDVFRFIFFHIVGQKYIFSELIFVIDGLKSFEVAYN